VTKALTGDEFDARLAPLGPFEPKPVLAVAVSGGADSMALALLAQDWAAKRGGRVIALTVDHGLRAESAAEAKLTGRRLKPWGISQRILTWQGEKPAQALQERAREARYRLLAQACRQTNAQHLLLAHTQEDQAETFLLRLARGSGVDGLSAMPPLAEREGLRLLRPLLDVPKARLIAALQERGVAWAEDPSNQNEAFERIRLRKAAPLLASLGLTSEALARSAKRLRDARQTLDALTRRALAEAVELHPAGFALIDPLLFSLQDEEIQRRVLARLLVTVGGKEHPPATEGLERLARQMGRREEFRGASLGGCRLAPWRGRVLAARAAEALPAPARIKPGEEIHWDGRFRIRLASRQSGILLAALGAEGARNLAAADPRLRKSPVPAAARAALPCFCDAEGVCAVPYLGYNRRGQELRLEVGFQPLRPLSGALHLAASSRRTI
jgi:tRNA(Ile)-lysidine synthase